MSNAYDEALKHLKGAYNSSNEREINYHIDRANEIFKSEAFLNTVNISNTYHSNNNYQYNIAGGPANTISSSGHTWYGMGHGIGYGGAAPTSNYYGRSS